MELVYWSVRQEWRGASYEVHFIRLYLNLVQHPSNNISIVKCDIQCYEFGTKYTYPGLVRSGGNGGKGGGWRISLF